MASDLPPTTESKTTDQVQGTNATFNSEKEIAQKPWEKDLASLVATHSSQFFSQPHETTSDTPSASIGNNAPASSRFSMAPAHSEANKEAVKSAFPVAATTWAPPTIGVNPSSKPSWTPPVSAINDQSSVGLTGADISKIASGWSPPKFVMEQQSYDAGAPSLPLALESTVASQPFSNSPKPQIPESGIETDVAFTHTSTLEPVEPSASFGSELKSPIQASTIEESIIDSTSFKDDVSAQTGGTAIADMAISTAPPTSATTLSTMPAPAVSLPDISVASLPKPMSPVANVSPPSGEALEEELLSMEKKHQGTIPSEEVVDSDFNVQLPKESYVNEPFISQSVKIISESHADGDLSLAREISENFDTGCMESDMSLVAESKTDNVSESAGADAPAPTTAHKVSEASLGEIDKSEPTHDTGFETAVITERVEGSSALLGKPSKIPEINTEEINESISIPAKVSKARAEPLKASPKPQPKRPLSPTGANEAPKAKAPKSAKVAAIGVPLRNTKVGKVFIMEKGSDFQAVSNLMEDIVAICCGSRHTLALTASGELYSWGSNVGSALGRTGNEEIPEKVEFDEMIEIVQIAAGGSISAVLTSSGDVYAWGTFYSNDEVLGFIGVPGKAQATPIKLSGKLPKNTQFMKVVAGKNHLLLLTTKGKVYVAGDMELGQLGVRMLRSREDEIPQGLRLNAISLKNVVSISAGGYHSFAITKEGEVYAWGSNKYLQCGIPSSGLDFEVSLALPTLSHALIDLSPIKIVSGDHHSLVLTSSNEVFGIGLNNQGQLGPIGEAFTPEDGELCASSPVAIMLPSSTAEVIASGPNHCLACSSSSLYLWGSGISDGSPKKVNEIQGYSVFSIAAGENYSVVLAASNADRME